MSDGRQSPAPGPTTVGPYTILSELGRGGMGTVYRARDKRLRRDVALKVLRADLHLTPERLARFENGLKGLAWLPDGSGLVYASAVGSGGYPPVFNLRTVSRDGGDDRQLTIGDDSFVDPEIVQPGKIFASRIRTQSDIWQFPISGSPTENVEMECASPARRHRCSALGEP